MKYFIALVGIVAFGFLLAPGLVKEQKSNQQPEVLGLATAIEKSYASAPEFGNVQKLPVFSAKAVFAYDYKSGTILHTNNLDEKLPIASLTKLMTAILVKEKSSFDKVVRVKKADLLVIGSNMGLMPGESITVGDLMKGMLVASSNDAAKVLAVAISGTEEAFVSEMNKKAEILKMTSTKFSNPVGLDSEDNYSTTYDLAKLVNEFLRHPELSEIVKSKEIEVFSVDKAFGHRLKTTNKLLFENSNIIGLKTGYTSLAKGNLIARYKDQDIELITIVLGSDDREEDTRRLLDWILAVYNW